MRMAMAPAGQQKPCPCPRALRARGQLREWRADAPVQVERDGVERQSGQEAPRTDLAQGRRQAVAAASNGGERYARSRLGELRPLVGKLALPLGIDRGRAADRQHEQSAEEDQRGLIAIDDEMGGRPEAYAPEEGMSRDAHHATG